MWRSPAISSLVGQLARAGDAWIRSPNCSYNTAVQAQISNINAIRSTSILENQYDRKAACEIADQKAGRVQKFQIGENVSRNDKIKFLVNTLLDLDNSREAVYGTLDAWVAWERTFPIVSLKSVLLTLEKEQQWHRVVQVIKWMLSKGQGNTMGTYGQLLQALDKDHRAEEAHMFWLKKVGTDLHSVPWQLCKRMISIYYRNNMLESLIKLFKSLEAFDRKPPEKSIIQKVADAYMMLGMLEEKKRALQKYNYLFQETEKGCLKKSRNTSSKKKSGHRKHTSNSEACMESLQ
ncbi:pentatricopeptide repeat-containing protein At4g18975, chloroplastic [Manihot esculenta]|uniref:Pentacotripeptide-repeat region of PRORP domain-containing protein n=4 Tax=Manihot esculenta TaxID=3983 RepID=A0A251JQJ5_MANES|nr:pentatricopeptide repeat-containing protein At4g18975, chloroplastic [Manihot esculenta]KAG8643026.1 hypothetical protein MANES_12G158500v8 [Manihot esculenta]OAY36134.1 hypothetical protein MANES_12G158500v8 [Manihot esculenta]OAY36135.1 hypothetical protein MANES_12G158500v8 [Manihot esculenta]